jgi:hypothetical protein
MEDRDTKAVKELEDAEGLAIVEWVRRHREARWLGKRVRKEKLSTAKIDLVTTAEPSSSFSSFIFAFCEVRVKWRAGVR